MVSLPTRMIGTRSMTFSMSGSNPARPTPSCWKDRDDLKWPADVYLEGTDQHRGWFHSSLLESSGTRGRAPYNAVITHGFTMDEEGRKMSKSLGNVTVPQKIVEQYGADILRVWTATVDYADDQRIGDEIIKSCVDSYRKLRNTLRWMLGSLAHFDEKERVAFEDMPELERLMLHRLAELDPVIRQAYRDFDYKPRVPDAVQFRDHRSVGVLFRHPQGRALLRSAVLHAPQGVLDGARPSVRVSGDLACTDPVLHHGRDLA
jgi:isoleucyl-tRNA synthetase